MRLRLVVFGLMVVACSGKDATVADPPIAVFVELTHTTPGMITSSGSSWPTAYAVEEAPLSAIITPHVDGPCLFVEHTSPVWRDAHFADVGPISFVLPRRTTTVFGSDRYSKIEDAVDPNEWTDGDVLVVKGAGNARFPAFDRSIRAASAITVTSPAFAYVNEGTVRTPMLRERDFTVTWTSKDPTQEALITFSVSDHVDNEWTHVRNVECRGSGGQLVVPASVVAFVTDTDWAPTYHVWMVVAERREVVTTERGHVTIVSRTPYISAALDDWTPIDVE